MEVDSRKNAELSQEHINYFYKSGFLVIRNALCEQELSTLQKETLELIEKMNSDNKNEDYWFNNDIPEQWYKIHGSNDTTQVKRGVPFRVEYPVDKSQSCRALMGHSFVLKATEQLLKTKNFIPTWDSLVFKMDGNGVPIKWHRDAGFDTVDSTPAIDIGYYLDDANTKLGNCLWVIPGSQTFPDFLASPMIEHLTNDGFSKSGAIPVEVSPGDVILHNILVLHGSSSCISPLRRTVYYEYRSIDQELKMGPHKPEYIPLKQKLLVSCLEERKKTNYDSLTGHLPFQYKPDDKYKVEEFNIEEFKTNLRFPHKQYFRSDYKG